MRHVTIYKRKFGLLVCEGKKSNKLIKASLESALIYYTHKGYTFDVKD